MKKKGNIEVYGDDEEIIEVLSKLPPMKEFDNMNILRYMQDRTEKSDFGTVVYRDGTIYTVYKFDKHLIKAEDAGLLMTISLEKNILEHIEIWKTFKESGMSFSNKIFDGLTAELIGIYSAYNLYRRSK